MRSWIYCLQKSKRYMLMGSEELPITWGTQSYPSFSCTVYSLGNMELPLALMQVWYCSQSEASRNISEPSGTRFSSFSLYLKNPKIEQPMMVKYLLLDLWDEITQLTAVTLGWRHRFHLKFSGLYCRHLCQAYWLASLAGFPDNLYKACVKRLLQ